MTHQVFFYPERACLKFVSRALKEHANRELPDEIGIVAILATAAALEASINSLFIAQKRMRRFDELRLASKIETLDEWCSSRVVHWGESPWQDVRQLIRVRNWLAHYKDLPLGLLSSEGWVKDKYHQPPKIDPYVELTWASVDRYYRAVMRALDMLVAGLYGSSFGERPDFLEDEWGETFDTW